MSFYEVNLAVFAAGNAYLLYKQYSGQKKVLEETKPVDVEEQNEHQNGVTSTVSPEALRQFQIEFFAVYALAVAADWLQGPHIYAIYKYEKNIPEKMVAALYATGFIAGAFSASFAGQLADRYGRRLACLVYCLSYSLTCLTMLSNNIYILILGRLCGGVSTTLLYSVFEAWLITEYHARGLQVSELKLSSIFGNMTTISCVVAIMAGVVGELLVSSLGGRVYPFLASVVCCIIASYLMLRTWRENYGTKMSQQASIVDVKTGILTIIRDRRILSLGITSCFFEGTMYLFVFFWSAALKSARTKSGSDEELPFGLIFSSFMCAMMAGSAFFSLYSPSHSKDTTSFILMAMCLTVSCCLSGAVLLENEKLLFWTLCMVEACIGAYFPSMSFLKSEVVEDGIRGSIYSILRMPLNLFVVVAHSLDEEGKSIPATRFTHFSPLIAQSAFFFLQLLMRLNRRWPQEQRLHDVCSLSHIGLLRC
jgi:MFS transporter, MFS domain-containing protein family, molybdate-anion transporter